MSNKDFDLSEEMLNALIDGEFPPEEKAELLARLQRDEDLNKQACETRALKEQVRNAYRHMDPPTRQNVPQSRSNPGLAAAAGLVLLIFGAVLGWGLRNDTPVTGAGGEERFALIDPDGLGQQVADPANGETRIVFHVTSPDLTTASELLDEVESLLGQYQRSDRLLRVEIVAHAEGLSLLQSNLSQHKRRISQLAGNFQNLTFVACRNTMDRVAVEKGYEVVLLPEAEVTESGVAHVVLRQRQGWAYIQV